MNVNAAILALAAAVPGACCGSFVATAAIRGARGEQVLAGRSHCDHCAAPLAFHQTIPLASYLLRGGECGGCGGRIDALHIFGEAGGAIVGASVILAPELASGLWLSRGLLAALGTVLLGLTLTDLRTLRLPDTLIACTGALSAALAWMTATLGVGLFAAAATFALLELLRRGFIALRSAPGLGFGDVKLLAALAIWLGPRTPLALALACVFALLARAATRTLAGRAAFGPAIVCAAWVLGLLPSSPGLWL